MKNNIFEVCNYGYPVLADEDASILITWNGSATFNIWSVDGADFTNTDVFTHECESASEAESVAKEWLNRELNADQDDET